VLFVVWAYVPDATLEAYGFTYFPSKHWAVAVPAMIVVTYVFSLVVYKAVNLMSTPELASYATILDTHTVPLAQGTTCFEDDTEATPGIGDISIFDVNRHLFSQQAAKQLKEE
jgi:phosphatidylinositol glycan class P protein